MDVQTVSIDFSWAGYSKINNWKQIYNKIWCIWCYFNVYQYIFVVMLHVQIRLWEL